MAIRLATKVSKHQQNGASGQPVIIMRISGDVSSASQEVVLGSYETLDKTLHRQILLDFKGVDYLNSSGIALVMQLLMQASKGDQRVAISGLTPHFTRVFALVRITKYAKLYTDEAAALAAF